MFENGLRTVQKVTVIGGSTNSPSSPVSFTLVNAATSTTTGTYSINGKSSITIEIYGAATSATVDFKCVSESGAQIPISGYRVSDFEIGTSGGMNEVWTFTNTENLVSFIVSLSSVTGGNVSIKGRTGG
jgi:hypothetical protein